MTRMPSKRKYIASGTDNLMRHKSDLDETDIQLLRNIQMNPRISMSDLAKTVKMSRPAVVDRIHKLEGNGVISGWRIDFDPARLGLPLTSYVRIRPIQGHLTSISNLARELTEVVECHRITGDDCFLMKVNVSSVKALERLIDRFLPYGQTTTSIVQSSPVPLRTPPLPDLRG